MLRDKTVLVTGAGGFIGSHLTERLAQEGAKVRAFVRYNSQNDQGLLELIPAETREKIDVIRGDVRDLKTIHEAMAGAEIVFHLAALVSIPYSYLHTQEVIDTNIIGTANVLLSAKNDGKLERIVLTSTSEVYGTAQYVPIDEKHPLQPQSPYAATKVGADALGLSFHRSFGLPVALVRPFNTYGPRQSARAVIPTIITQALTKDKIKIGALTPTRDLTYVSDTVEGFLRIATSPKSVGEVINIGSGSEISIGDLTHRIISLIGRDVTVEQEEERLRPAASEVQRLCADSSKARHLLNWQPAVSIEAGLTETIEWISKSMYLYRPEKYSI